MTGMERHGSHKRDRKTAARIGNHKDVVAEVSAIREEEKKSLRASKLQEKTDGKTEKAKSWFQAQQLGGGSVSVIPERQSECTR